MKIVKQIEKTANIRVLHTFLLSVYPILGLYALNVAEAKLSEIYRPILVSMLLTLLLLFLVKMILKDWLKSALIVSLTLLVFFSYGHFYNYLKAISIGNFVVGRHRLLLPIVIGVFLFGIAWIIRHSQGTTNINNMMNLVMMSIMIFPIYQIGSFWIGDLNSRLNQSTESEFLAANFESPLDYQPDVYFIVLDSYGRSDTLNTLYAYDNEPFLDELREMGFFVAECSQSNYSFTRPSIASALNMEYVQNFWQESFRTTPFFLKIWDNRFRTLLENQGHKTIALETGVFWSEITNSDLYLSRIGDAMNPIERMSNFGTFSNFEALLLDTTILQSLSDLQFKFNNLMINFNNDSNLNHRRVVLYELEILNNLPSIPGPKFIFAHIVSPHPPFVFSANGEYPEEIYGNSSNENNFKEGYTNQISYLNSRIPQILESLIKNSEELPIIIMIGDHGPRNIALANYEIYNSTNLTAVYLPGDGNQHLYNQITPINIMRIVSTLYFGSDLEMVKDIHYAFEHNEQKDNNSSGFYTFTPIPDPNEKCETTNGNNP